MSDLAEWVQIGMIKYKAQQEVVERIEELEGLLADMTKASQEVLGKSLEQNEEIKRLREDDRKNAVALLDSEVTINRLCDELNKMANPHFPQNEVRHMGEWFQYVAAKALEKVGYE